ncbi:MAG: HEAT repeat domain-containing protein [Thermodesulfobacteriota bacterium]
MGHKMDSSNATPTTILNELNKAVKMHNFYPSGHPHFETALGQCYLHIKRCVDERGVIKYSINHKGFQCDSKSISADSEEIGELAKKFFLRKIKELEITTRLSSEDIKELVYVLRLEPSEISDVGGIERFFAERGVEGLLLNEMHYEGLKKLKAELQQRKAEEVNTLAADSGVEEIAIDEEADGKDTSQSEDDAKARDEDLMEMIEKIREEQDLLKYNDLSVRIKERSAALIAVNSMDEVMPAIFTFFELSRPGPRERKDYITMAETQLKSLLRLTPFLRHLTQRAGSKEEINRETIEQCLLIASDTAIVINLLLDDAVQAPEAIVRRNIYNTLLLFGEKLIPFIEERIRSGVWYEVRQMAALLGEIGDTSNLHLLEEIYQHDNVKIKKEALKSLARIPSVEAAAFLSKALEEEDTSLVSQAIVSLGFLRDTSALEAITAIALIWEPFAKSHNLQKEAIKALGNIGSPDSVPALSQILMRKSWFSRQDNDELRGLAAKALGMIDDEKAYKALEKAMKKTEGSLYATCKRALEKKTEKTG